MALAQAAVAGATDARDRLAELAAYTGARTREGVTAEGDLIRVQVELARADATLAMERVELARARGELVPFVDDGVTPVPSGEGIRVAVDTTAPLFGGHRAPPVLASLGTYVARARAGRPDLVAARARVAAARAETNYQRTLAVRQLGATLGTKRIGGVNTMIAGLSIPLPLFEQNRGEVQRVSAERSAIEREVAWRERQVTAEVTASYEAVRLLAEQRSRLSGTFMARAEMSRRIALAAYREGAVGLLQVIDASRTLADVRLTYYRTLFAERESLLELTVISGSELLGAVPQPSSSSIEPSTTSRPVGRTGVSP